MEGKYEILIKELNVKKEKLNIHTNNVKDCYFGAKTGKILESNKDAWEEAKKSGKVFGTWAINVDDAYQISSLIQTRIEDQVESSEDVINKQDSIIKQLRTDLENLESINAYAISKEHIKKLEDKMDETLKELGTLKLQQTIIIERYKPPQPKPPQLPIQGASVVPKQNTNQTPTQP